MRRRTWISLAVALAVVAALFAAAYLRKQAPPEVARLLPEADGIIYFNLKPLRTLVHFDQHPVRHDPGYQKFIDATGIVFERDLDQVAFAVHRLENPSGPNGAFAFSEVFQGRFNGHRLTAYLQSRSSVLQHYAGHTIYTLSDDGRTIRVVLLGYDMVAVSNTPQDKSIHAMIDRYQAAASPFSGDTLLKKYYSKVPLLSEAWGIGKLGTAFGPEQQIHIFHFPITLPAESTLIASLRYLGSIHLRLEEIAPTRAAAEESVGLVKLAVELLRSMQETGATENPEVKDWNSLLNSITVKQKGTRAILEAVVPTRLVRSLMEGDSGQDHALSATPTPETPLRPEP